MTPKPHVARLARLGWAALLLILTLGQPVLAQVSERFTVAKVPVDFLASPGVPIVDVILSFDAGSRRDPPGQAGTAELTHTLIAKGTAQRDEQAISEAFADLATSLTGSVDIDRATLTWRMLAQPEVIDGTIALIAEILGQATFPEAVVERERQRAVAALQDALTRPEVIANRTLTATLYAGHPYGQLATPESLAARTRTDLIDFFRRHYTRATAHITIVGDIDRTAAERLAATIANSLPAGEPLPPLPPLPAPPRTPRLPIAIDHPAEQTHWAIGMALITRDDPDYFPLLVGNWILGGGGFNSRLMREVREARGYAYSVSSALEPLALPGPWTIALQTRGRHAEAAREVVAATIKNFLAEGPSEDELALAKRALADGFGLRLDSNRKLASFLSVVGYYRLPPDWLARYPEAVRAVTAQAIHTAFTQRINPAALTWVRVGGSGDRAESAKPQPPTQPTAPAAAAHSSVP